MANSRLSLRKILEVLRLHHEGNLSHREIARAISAPPTTVDVSSIGPSSPASSGRCRPLLEALWNPSKAPSNRARPEPDWHAVHCKLRRKCVTPALIHPFAKHVTTFIITN